MADKGSLPHKLYFRIGEVAGLVGVEPHVLRYWEREFRTIRPTKSARGQRVYSRRDVETLMRVRDLLYSEGFTIAGARKKLMRGGDAKTAPAAEAKAEEVAAPKQAAAPVATTEPAPPRSNRAALLELKAEIEAFLDELG
jgi:DNA-binding transcriptional MerR regulator